MLVNNKVELYEKIRNEETPYFSYNEIKCKNCCNQFLVSDKSIQFLKIMNRFRHEVGSPLYSTNLYRCPTKNKNIGGAPRSRHMSAIAMDFYSRTVDIADLFKYAFSFGEFTGLGIYQWDKGNYTIHADIGHRQHKTYWVKPLNGHTTYFYNYYQAEDYFKKNRVL